MRSSIITYQRQIQFNYETSNWILCRILNSDNHVAQIVIYWHFICNCVLPMQFCTSWYCFHIVLNMVEGAIWPHLRANGNRRWPLQPNQQHLIGLRWALKELILRRRTWDWGGTTKTNFSQTKRLLYRKSFSVVWCENRIYILGVDAALGWMKGFSYVYCLYSENGFPENFIYSNPSEQKQTTISLMQCDREVRRVLI